MVTGVVQPALLEAERQFSTALARINLEDMAKRADGLNSVRLPLPACGQRATFERSEGVGLGALRQTGESFLPGSLTPLARHPLSARGVEGYVHGLDSFGASPERGKVA